MRAQILNFPAAAPPHSAPPEPVREEGYADFAFHFEPDGIKHAICQEKNIAVTLIVTTSEDAELRHIRRSERNLRTGQEIHRSTLLARVGSLRLEIKGREVVCASGSSRIEFAHGRMLTYEGNMETGMKGKVRWVNDGSVRAYIIIKNGTTHIVITRQDLKL